MLEEIDARWEEQTEEALREIQGGATMDPLPVFGWLFLRK